MPSNLVVNNPKVLVISTELDFGGVETGILSRARAQRAAGFEMVFACLHKRGRIGNILLDEGFELHDLDSSPKLQNLRNIFRLRRIVREVEPDVVHTISIEANFHGVIAASLAGVKTIVAEEVGIPSSSGKEANRSWKARTISRMIWKRANRILAISEAVKRYLIVSEGADQSKIFVIPHFADESFLSLSLTDREVRDVPVIGCVGRLSREKGQRVLLNAFGIVLKTQADAQLWFIGDGPDRADLEKEACEIGIYQNVTFFGVRMDVPDLLKRMNIFVLPSLTEGFGIAVLEGMAAHIPVIASNVGGVPEVITHEENGFLVSPGDSTALAAQISKVILLDDREIAAIVGNARQLVEERYSSEAVVGLFEEFYGRGN